MLMFFALDNQRVFPAGNVTTLENKFGQGLRDVNCSCNHQKMSSPRQKELHVIILKTMVVTSEVVCSGFRLGAGDRGHGRGANSRVFF